MCQQITVHDEVPKHLRLQMNSRRQEEGRLFALAIKYYLPKFPIFLEPSNHFSERAVVTCTGAPKPTI